MSDIKAPFLVNEIEITYRNRVPFRERVQINSATTAHDYFRQNWDDAKIGLQEEFKILLLDRANRALGVTFIARGGISSTTVDRKLIFATALKARASAIILAHNHPSGHLKPSQSDLRLTQILIHGAKLLDIDIIDHLVMTEESFFSMAENGCWPS